MCRPAARRSRAGRARWRSGSRRRSRATSGAHLSGRRGRGGRAPGDQGGGRHKKEQGPEPHRPTSVSDSEKAISRRSRALVAFGTFRENRLTRARGAADADGRSRDGADDDRLTVGWDARMVNANTITGRPQMSLTIVNRDDLERTGSWSLVRRSLGIASFGVNIVEIAPGTSIPEHDEVARDQEELFVVLSGDADARRRRRRPPRPRRHLRPARPRAEAHRPQRRRRAGRGADRLGAAHERLRADGVGVSAPAVAPARAARRRAPAPGAGGLPVDVGRGARRPRGPPRRRHARRGGRHLPGRRVAARQPDVLPRRRGGRRPGRRRRGPRPHRRLLRRARRPLPGVGGAERDRGPGATGCWRAASAPRAPG